MSNMTDRELLNLALEALDSDNPDIQLRTAIALRAHLAEQEPEPVAWMAEAVDGRPIFRKEKPVVYVGEKLTPLYTALPQRKPMTDDEIAKVKTEIWGNASIAPQSATSFARAIERKITGGNDE